jgi:hypothetical protein
MHNIIIKLVPDATRGVAALRSVMTPVQAATVVHDGCQLVDHWWGGWRIDCWHLPAAAATWRCPVIGDPAAPRCNETVLADRALSRLCGGYVAGANIGASIFRLISAAKGPHVKPLQLQADTRGVFADCCKAPWMPIRLLHRSNAQQMKSQFIAQQYASTLTMQKDADYVLAC